MDMSTSISGSGPACDIFPSCTRPSRTRVPITAPHSALRCSRATSRQLGASDHAGSVKYAMESGEHPRFLKNSVTSPAGTAASAISANSRRCFRTVVQDAIIGPAIGAAEMGGSINVGPGRSAGPKPTTEFPDMNGRRGRFYYPTVRCFFFARSFFFRAPRVRQYHGRELRLELRGRRRRRQSTASSSPSSLAPKPQNDAGAVSTVASSPPWPRFGLCCSRLCVMVLASASRVRLEELRELALAGLVELDHVLAMRDGGRARAARSRGERELASGSGVLRGGDGRRRAARCEWCAALARLLCSGRVQKAMRDLRASSLQQLFR